MCGSRAGFFRRVDEARLAQLIIRIILHRNLMQIRRPARGWIAWRLGSQSEPFHWTQAAA
jgi:hypothetical protein